jgi:hemerythrin-like domain-containing protein
MTTPDLSAYRAVHTALRLAPHRLIAAVRNLDPADARRIKALDAYWRGYAAEVLTHHSIEDDLVFPALVTRAPAFATLIERTDADHHVLDEVMTACALGTARLVASPTSDRTQLLADLGTLAAHMDEHLDFEDEEILPIIVSELTAEDFEELERAAAKATGAGLQAAFAVPFVVSSIPEHERAHLIKTAPVPLRVLYALFKGRHARLSARVFGAAAGQPALA